MVLREQHTVEHMGLFTASIGAGHINPAPEGADTFPYSTPPASSLHCPPAVLQLTKTHQFFSGMSFQHPRPEPRPRSQANASDSNSDDQPPAFMDFSSKEQNEDTRRVLGFLSELLQTNAIHIPPYHPDSTLSSATRGPGVYD
jgi:hypothetical protein